MNSIEQQSLLKDLPLEKDVSVAHLLRVSDMQLKESKNNSKYLQFTLADQSMEVKWCKKWKCTDDDYEKFKNCKVLFVVGKTDIYNNKLQIVCDSLAIPEDEVATEFLESSIPKSSYDINFMKKEIWKYIQDIKNPFIKKLTESIILDEKVKETLSRIPAGLSVHHNYQGGLLCHIYRLLLVGDSLVKCLNEHLFPGENTYSVNRDIVLFSIITHDIFKGCEYSPSMEYLKDGNLIGHLPMAAIEINRKMDKIDNFPEEIRKQLTHVILSHHGNKEWGSPVTPKTLEAIIVHYLDMLMSRVDPILESLQLLPKDQFWTEKLKCVNSEVYAGGRLIDEKH